MNWMNDLENRMVMDSQWENSPFEYHEPAKLAACIVCRCGIYEGDTAFDIDGDIICEDCIKGYMVKHYPFRRCGQYYK